MPRRYNKYSYGKYGLPHMGEVIAYHRIKAGWTSQADFAIVCGVDKQTVAYWEKQEYLADMDRRIFLCKLLNITPGLLGLTWRSVANDEQSYMAAFENVEELLKENSYGLYEDLLALAHTSPDKYSPSSAYRFYKHRQELERIVTQAPEGEKGSWIDLLSRYYQHSTFIAQHRGEEKQALSYANTAIKIATLLRDNDLLGTAYYRRSRLHLSQKRPHSAREDIEAALDKSKHAYSSLKGSSYLLAAEINSLYAEGDATLKKQCRNWQDMSANLLYKGIEDDETFLTFNLYAVHHERAKTLLRFAFFHKDDEDLLQRLQSSKYLQAKKSMIDDAENALSTARTHLMESSHTRQMYLSITEARAYLITRDFEECARVAKSALQHAKMAHSQQGINEIKKIYSMLTQLVEKNPYVSNLGVELGVFN